MKQYAMFILLCIVSQAFSVSAEVASSAPGRVHHIVIVWLKDHGSAAARQQYIEATRDLSKLPMVWRYQVGTALPGGGRQAVDSSYDVAINATFENAKALEAYLQHEDHARILQEKLKPLVDRAVVYDFVDAP